MFIEVMNKFYYSPKEIEYRIPEIFKGEKMLELVLAIRKQKTEKIFALTDQNGDLFRYWKTPKLDKILHEIDVQQSKWREKETNSIVWKELLTNNLIDEAFYSSWIEGAKTTRIRVEELTRANSKPKDRSEQMCFNNWEALKFILKNLERPLSKDFLCDLHYIVTKATLYPEDQPFAGKYRNDSVEIVDVKQTVDYTPPPYTQVPDMMERLFSWVNWEGPDSFFVHPVLKASIIHFYTVYVHPFFDGNGRTARALMYYYLLKHGYQFMQYFSVSKAIANNRNSYYQAILNVEKYGSDLTYFLLHSAQMILNAISIVEKERKIEDSFIDWIAQLNQKDIFLNKRQKKLFQQHFRSKLFPITIKKYKKMFKVVYETARSDLMLLVKKNLLKMTKEGKEFVFDLMSENETALV